MKEPAAIRTARSATRARIFGTLLLPHWFSGLYALLTATAFNASLWAMLNTDVPDEPVYMREVLAFVDSGVLQSFSGHRAGLFTVLGGGFVHAGRVLGFADLMAARLLGVCCVVGVAWLTYRIAVTLLPGERRVALLASALVAFNPMYVFIGASVTPDTLLAVASTAAVYASVAIIRDRPTKARIALFLLAMLTGLYTKERMVVLLPLLILTPALYALRHLIRKTDWQRFLKAEYWSGEISPKATATAVLSAGAMIGIVLLAPLSSRLASSKLSMYSLSPPRDVLALVKEPAFNDRLLEQAWAYFGYLHVPSPLPFYELFKWFIVLGLVGLGIMGAGWVVRCVGPHSEDTGKNPADVGLPLSLVLLAATFFFALYGAAQYHLISNGGSQGRYLFISIAPFYVLMAIGLSRLAGSRYRPLLVSTLVMGAVFANLYGMLYVMTPYFY